MDNGTIIPTRMETNLQLLPGLLVGKEAPEVTPVAETFVVDTVFESFVRVIFVFAGDLGVDVLVVIVLVVLAKNYIRLWTKKLL